MVEPSFITTQMMVEHYIRTGTINNTDTIMDIIDRKLLNDRKGRN